MYVSFRIDSCGFLLVEISKERILFHKPENLHYWMNHIRQDANVAIAEIIQNCFNAVYHRCKFANVEQFEELPLNFINILYFSSKCFIINIITL